MICILWLLGTGSIYVDYRLSFLILLFKYLETMLLGAHNLEYSGELFLILII